MLGASGEEAFGGAAGTKGAVQLHRDRQMDEVSCHCHTCPHPRVPCHQAAPPQHPD